VTSTSFTGGKGQAGVFHRIIGQMPPHPVYVEAFFGAGRVFWNKRPADFNVVIDRMSKFIARAGVMAGVRAIVGDAITWLPRLTLPADAVVYLDPPYVLSTRQGRFYYDFELSDEQHCLLLSVAQSLPCRVLISGYPSELYDSRLGKWRVMRYRVRTRGRTVTECLWMNFPEPVELHDWRYAGQNFRQRVTFKRLAARWLARLQGMPPRKRGYLLDAIAQRHPQRCVPAANAENDDDADRQPTLPLAVSGC
jgi:hypothetical protein